MKTVPLNQMPLPASTRSMLISDERIQGAVYSPAVPNGPAATIAVYGKGLPSPTLQDVTRLYPRATLHWTRSRSQRKTTKAKTWEAVDLVVSGKVENAHAAAIVVGVDVAAVYRALKERETRGVCPCCGQLNPRQRPGA
jgi:hypothetical protein